MMPQKKNPDLFELIRGKSGRALGALTALCTTVKGLPVGFMLDLQEDKTNYLEAFAGLTRSLEAFNRGLQGIRYRQERMAQALVGGETQATDLAERLVSHGIPFRSAYKAVGALVGVARAKGLRFEQLGRGCKRAATWSGQMTWRFGTGARGRRQGVDRWHRP